MARHIRVALSLVFCLLTPLTGSVAAQGESITVDDPRPLAQAIRTFQEAYGFPVSYEDPRFAHSSELVDVSTIPGRAATAAATVRRALIPRGGSFTATFEPPAPDAQPSDIAERMRTVVGQYHARGYPGRFRVIEAGGMIHVVPQAVLGADGSIVPASSILDTRVSLPHQKDRTMQAGVRAVLAAVSAATGRKINLGTSPTNLMMQSVMEEGAADLPARDILVRAFKATGRDLSWRLLYGADDQFYAFNVLGLNLGKRR